MPTTADQLITAVLRKCFWDTTSQPLTNTEILAIADEVILGDMWPKIIGSAGDYYVSATQHTLESGYSRYRLPARMFGPIRDVLLVDGDEEYSIPLIDLEDLGRLSELAAPADRFFHFLDGDYVGLYPTPDSGDESMYLRIRYYRAPSNLVLSASSTTVNAIDVDSSATTFTIVANPLSWTAGSSIDVIGQGNAHQVLGESMTVSGVSTLTVTISSPTTLAGTGIQSGDYVANAGYTPIVQVPDFMVPQLITLVAAECLEASGDRDSANRLFARAQQLDATNKHITRPRTVAEPAIVMGRGSPWSR